MMNGVDSTSRVIPRHRARLVVRDKKGDAMAARRPRKRYDLMCLAKHRFHWIAASFYTLGYRLNTKFYSSMSCRSETSLPSHWAHEPFGNVEIGVNDMEWPVGCIFDEHIE
jgi:hypothetical protein